VFPAVVSWLPETTLPPESTTTGPPYKNDEPGSLANVLKFVQLSVSHHTKTPCTAVRLVHSLLHAPRELPLGANSALSVNYDRVEISEHRCLLMRTTTTASRLCEPPLLTPPPPPPPPPCLCSSLETPLPWIVRGRVTLEGDVKL
jgi:hypothetical protein